MGVIERQTERGSRERTSRAGWGEVRERKTGERVME